MTKAEECAIICIDYWITNLDCRTWGVSDVLELVDAHLWNAYKRGVVPPVSREKALRLTEKEWKRRMR